MARKPRTSARAAGQPFLTGAKVSKCSDFGYGERVSANDQDDLSRLSALFFDPVLKFRAQTGSVLGQRGNSDRGRTALANVTHATVHQPDGPGRTVGHQVTSGRRRGRFSALC